mgnify:CR=1 FL=1
MESSKNKRQEHNLKGKKLKGLNAQKRTLKGKKLKK